jgi:hypothetical protein
VSMVFIKNSRLNQEAFLVVLHGRIKITHLVRQVADLIQSRRNLRMLLT